MLKIDKL